MKKRPKERIERRKLADGTIKTYRYAARKTSQSDIKTVARVLAAWQISPEWDLFAKSTKTGYVLYSGAFYDAFKSNQITDIKRRHILTQRDIIAKDRGHGAASAFCRTMQSFFKWVVDREYIEASPAVRLEGSLNHGSLPAWTMEQALFAESKLPEHYARAVFLARHTAQRRGDLCKMRWSQYNGSTIYLKQEKTGVELDIPVTPELKSALDQWKATTKGLTIIANARGEPLSPGSLSAHLPEELIKIGLPPLGIHGLRKLAAATLANAGCSTHEIMAITGHKTLAMVQDYTKSADQKILSQAAVSRLVIPQKPTKTKKSL